MEQQPPQHQSNPEHESGPPGFRFDIAQLMDDGGSQAVVALDDAISQYVEQVNQYDSTYEGADLLLAQYCHSIEEFVYTNPDAGRELFGALSEKPITRRTVASSIRPLIQNDVETNSDYTMTDLAFAISLLRDEDESVRGIVSDSLQELLTQPWLSPAMHRWINAEMKATEGL